MIREAFTHSGSDLGRDSRIASRVFENNPAAQIVGIDLRLVHLCFISVEVQHDSTRVRCATIAEESTLSHYYCRFSGAKMGLESSITHSVESDKRSFGRLENGPNSSEIAEFRDLSLLTPTCDFAKRRAKKRGDYKVRGCGQFLGPA